MSAEMSDAEEQCERGIEADADAADDADPAGGAPASGTTGPHDAQPQASLLANEAAAADDTAAAADAPAAADEGAAAPSAATALNLQSAADCEAFLRTLPGGEVALEQAAAVTASLNARHDVLHQEELTYLLQAWHSSISTQLHKAMALDAEARAGQSSQIELAVESCLAAAVRRRVTDILWQQHAAADRLLLNTARGLADGSSKFLPRSSSMAEANALADTMSAMHAGGLRAEVLAMCGVAEPLRQLDLAMPAEALFSLATMSCPLEGINCLQRVTDALVEEAHRCRESTGNGDPISSDDLLPLLIAILIQAQLPHLYSCLQYLANFHSSGDWNGAAGFLLATLEAAITFLQQQAPQEGSQPEAGVNTSDDTDDSAPTPGPRSKLKRQNTGQRRLLAALDSDAPLSFAQTSPPSRPARSRQRGVRAMWPPPACECRSCLPAVAKTSVAAMVQLWETGPAPAPPPASLSLLPASASILLALFELEEITLAKRAAQQQWLGPPSTSASRPVLQQPVPAASPPLPPAAPDSVQPADTLLIVQMEPLPPPAVTLVLPVVAVQECSPPPPSLRQLSSSDACVAAEPDSVQPTPSASPVAPAKSAVLSPATALAMMPRAPPASLQRAAPLVMTPPTAQRPAQPTTPDAESEGVGIAMLLSPQLHARPGSGSGGGVLPAARRCASGPRAAAQPCPIPRRQVLSPARPLDLGPAGAPDAGCDSAADGYGAAAHIAHVSVLQSVWEDPGLTPLAAVALPGIGSKPLQPHDVPFQPASKPTQRKSVSPLMQASLAEEAAAASQAAALRYRALGRQRRSHSSVGSQWQPSAGSLRKVLFQDENTGQAPARGAKPGSRTKGGLGGDAAAAPSRAPLAALQRTSRAAMSHAPPPLKLACAAEAEPLFAADWLLDAMSPPRTPEALAQDRLETASSSDIDTVTDEATNMAPALTILQDYF